MVLESVIQSEVSKKKERERERKIINTYIQNLEKWNRQTYFQDRNGDADVENVPNGLADTMAEGEVEGIGKAGLSYRHYRV